MKGEILHSGKFLDYEGCDVEVTFWKRYRLDISVTSKVIQKQGGSFDVTIWCPDGDAYIADGYPDWVTIKLKSSERVPGYDYYRYTYTVTATRNTNRTPRIAQLRVIVEGISAGVLSKQIGILQNG